MHACMHACMHARTHARAGTHTRTYVCMSVRMGMFVCLCVCVYIYIYIYIDRPSRVAKPAGQAKPATRSQTKPTRARCNRLERTRASHSTSTHVLSFSCCCSSFVVSSIPGHCSVSIRMLPFVCIYYIIKNPLLKHNLVNNRFVQTDLRWKSSVMLVSQSLAGNITRESRLAGNRSL